MYVAIFFPHGSEDPAAGEYAEAKWVGDRLTLTTRAIDFLNYVEDAPIEVTHTDHETTTTVKGRMMGESEWMDFFSIQPVEKA